MNDNTNDVNDIIHTLNEHTSMDKFTTHMTQFWILDYIYELYECGMIDMNEHKQLIRWYHITY